MTVQQPISHHYSPVFYQKPWAVDGRVTRYYRPHKAVVADAKVPKAIGCEDHLYDFEGLPVGAVAPSLESQFFSPVDSRAAVVHQRLLAGELNKLSPQEREDWARFLLSMQLRNPFALAEVKRLAEQNLRANLDRETDPEYQAVRRPGDPETIWEWTQVYEPHVIQNAHKQFLPSLIDHKELGQYLMNMHWATIDVSTATQSLLTGDRPLISTHGWKDPNCVVHFPLSPHTLFAATNSPAVTGRLLALPRTPLVKWMNNEIARCAVDLVIGQDDKQLLFVERRLRQRDQDPVPGPVGKGRPNCPA